MQKFIVALLLVASATAHFLPKEDSEVFKFMNFIKKFNRQYESPEQFQEKFAIFKTNLEKVADHDKLTPFMDITEEEFRAKYLTLDASAIAAAKSKMESFVPKLTMGEVPESLDWVEKGLVSHVKDQGQCGSCWAFSAVANIEGQYAKKHGKIVTFSEQELVDCDHVDQGCNGGLMDNAFQQLMKIGGLVDDATYPYTGVGGSCKFPRFTNGQTVAKVLTFKDISRNEEEIKRALAEVGPLSVAVDANSFFSYQGGVHKSCGVFGLNHGVTLVGYGTDEETGETFWKVKNSWGAVWGEEGYIRLQYGVGCVGINQNVSTSQVE